MFDIQCLLSSFLVILAILLSIYYGLGTKLNIQKTKIIASGHITSWQIDGEGIETVTDFIFLGSKISADLVTAAMKLKDACFLEEKLWST